MTELLCIPEYQGAKVPTPQGEDSICGYLITEIDTDTVIGPDADMSINIDMPPPGKVISEILSYYYCYNCHYF